MKEGLYLAAIAMMITRAAGKHGLWSVASKRQPNDCRNRVWWFGRHGKEQIFQRGLTDEEAIVWLERGYLGRMGA